jgi:hypothetical protein
MTNFKDRDLTSFVVYFNMYSDIPVVSNKKSEKFSARIIRTGPGVEGDTSSVFPLDINMHG